MTDSIEELKSELAASAGVSLKYEKALSYLRRSLSLLDLTQEEVRLHKQSEAELQAENEYLRQEIEAREQLIADLDSFTHTVAHDLKTPLTIIEAGSGFLSTSLGSKLDPEQLEVLDTLMTMGSKMGTIIDELMILSAVPRQSVTPAPLNMDPIIDEVIVRLKRMIEKTEAKIARPKAWPVALGYAPWIEEVWYNYLSNAIKYGGKPPRLELGAEDLEDGKARFWVTDNGNGVSSQRVRELFKPYSRLENPELQGHSHGLGLSIVFSIVKKLGGDVGAESENIPGKGSTFSFTLPGAKQSSSELKSNAFTEDPFGHSGL